MSFERQPKPRPHEAQVARVLTEQQQNRADDTEAQNRIDRLLYEYILSHPEQLKKWLDFNNYAD